MGVVSWCNLSLVGVAWTQWVCLWPQCVWHGLGECDMGVGLRRGGGCLPSVGVTCTHWVQCGLSRCEMGCEIAYIGVP